ncbi:phosphatidate phosphatase LPIN3-like [Drosophila miranda]|uniref:phosphatidate phosphatase LPIN3-like n=1 Tax=Drosophila miranda TaxID=7229 RepID=UPI00143F8598|nr:phosphatidate phosphatase LPIN3-like [Drosophila miranda]
MNSLARVFSNFRDFYSEINAATLTGAIDVIVVEQKDWEFQCSPFHVRFGKMGVLRSREKVMKLGDAGKAFFVEECLEDDDDELPANLATSPIPLSFMNLREHGNDTMEDISGVTDDKNASEELQIPLPLPRRNSIDFSKEEPKEAAAHFENQASDYTKRRHTDNTLERRNLSEKLKEFTTQKIRQEWAEHEELFQEKSEKKPAEAELEKYRQPEAGEEVEKEKEQPKADITVSSVAASEDAKDVSKSKTKKRRKKTQMKKNAQRKNSSSSSVGSAAGGDVTTTKEGVATVDNIDEGDATAPATAVAIIAANNSANSSSNDELPSASLLTAHTGIDSAKGEEPKAIANPTVKLRLHLEMYFFSDTEITGPSGGATNRPPSPFQSDSELETTIRARDQRQFDQTAANWNWGELPDQAKTESIYEADAQQVDRQSMLSNVFSFMKKANRLRKEVGNEAGDIYLSDLNESMDPEMAALYFPSSKLKEASTATILEEDRESGNGTSLPHSPSSLEEGQKSMDSDFDENNKPPLGGGLLSPLCPVFDYAAFSVTTAYQGTSRCKCYLYRWKHNDKVVISDIDGTITRSDVLGHILPMVGKDWAQLGVAQLFSKIEQNGYKLLYLSARAIGQSRLTREYLRSIRQGNVKLPDGPLLLNPTSLISAFHREVIEKKPQQFKIACLSDIRDLFPEKEPFYAGYGNRINDVWAYRAVGIPIMRIFTINTKGELKHELTQTFQSSGYINQSLEVDEYFPLLTHNDEYEYRTDVFDDDELEDELQFSDDYDVDAEPDLSDDDDDDDGLAALTRQPNVAGFLDHVTITRTLP